MTERGWIMYYWIIVVLIVIGMFIFFFRIFTMVNAKITMLPTNTFQDATVGPRRLLPAQIKIQVIRSYTARITEYNSTPGQTSGDPFITANGEHVYFGGVAVNCVKFGTKLRLPKIFGNKVFRINDRGGMPCGNVDVWLDPHYMHGWRGTQYSLVQIIKP